MTHPSVPSSVAGCVVSLKPGFAAAAAAEAARGARYTPRCLSILLVEPSAEAQALLDRHLRRMPWFEAQVTLAGSVEAARFALATGEIDVVLLAEGAEPDGLDFARELASKAGGPPVILVSPLLANEVEYEALSFGVSACIELSEITPRVIETYVRSALWRRAAQQQALSEAPRAPAHDPAHDRTVGANDNVIRFQRRPAGA